MTAGIALLATLSIELVIGSGKDSGLCGGSAVVTQECPTTAAVGMATLDVGSAAASVLVIEVTAPQTHGFGRNRYTDYEVSVKVKYLVRRI